MFVQRSRNFLLCAALGIPVALGVSACGGSDSRPAAQQAAADTVPDIPGPAATPLRAPDRYRVRMETGKGAFVIEVTRALAPHGADRFYELVTIGFFRDVSFYRMVPGFIAQFGMHGTPTVHDKWRDATIPDDPMRTGNVKGTVTFAANGPNSRSTQLFISLEDNRRKLDGQKVFAPIGKVVEGMDVVERLNMEYGEEPNYVRIARQGNAYLVRWFPAIEYIKTATVVPDA
ncbi:MAG: peptidylprolyl isomerase [Gemmatimonadaceae bacterium]|nr:peptidylprolyl isomerase [Gemmatimonadaceae bacterium]